MGAFAYYSIFTVQIITAINLKKKRVGFLWSSHQKTGLYRKWREKAQHSLVSSTDFSHNNIPPPASHEANHDNELGGERAMKRRMH